MLSTHPSYYILVDSNKQGYKQQRSSGEAEACTICYHRDVSAAGRADFLVDSPEAAGDGRSNSGLETVPCSAQDPEGRSSTVSGAQPASRTGFG